MWCQFVGIVSKIEKTVSNEAVFFVLYTHLNWHKVKTHLEIAIFGNYYLNLTKYPYKLLILALWKS